MWPNERKTDFGTLNYIAIPTTAGEFLRAASAILGVPREIILCSEYARGDNLIVYNRGAKCPSIDCRVTTTLPKLLVKKTVAAKKVNLCPNCPARDSLRSSAATYMYM